MDNYKIIKIIGKGKFGTIYYAKNKKDQPVAIKTEQSNQDYSSIKHEVKMMNYLFRNNFKQLPMIYWYGKYKNLTCLIMTYYDCSLEQYMKNVLFKHKSNDIILQCINIIEYIHKYYILHRDIKPQNFMIKNNNVFLIDFGLSIFYVDEYGEHKPNELQLTIIGTPKYLSYNNHVGNTISRRDDLISIGYLYMSFYYILPWQNILSNIESEKSLLDIEHPSNIQRRKYKSLENLFIFLKEPNYTKQIIYNIKNYMTYCYSLDYDSEPSYYVIKQLFIANH